MKFAAPPENVFSRLFKEHQVYILTYVDLPGGVWWFLPKSQVSTNLNKGMWILAATAAPIFSLGSNSLKFKKHAEAEAMTETCHWFPSFPHHFLPSFLHLSMAGCQILKMEMIEN